MSRLTHTNQPSRITTPPILFSFQICEVGGLAIHKRIWLLSQIWLHLREQCRKGYESCYILVTYYNLLFKYNDFKKKLPHICGDKVKRSITDRWPVGEHVGRRNKSLWVRVAQPVTSPTIPLYPVARFKKERTVF
jgi:hypothetical protein